MESTKTMPRETRANVLAGLAGCYARPGPDLDALLAASAEDSGSMGEFGAQMFSDLLGKWRENTLQELLVDYAALFVGPFETIAPPFGSVYLEDRPILMGPSTRDVREYYRQAGLDMAESFNGPPDHITAQLEFLAFLVAGGPAAGPGEAQGPGDLKQRFLEEHLGAWVAPFTAKMEDGAKTGFYRLLAGLTRKAVLSEKGG